MTKFYLFTCLLFVMLLAGKQANAQRVVLDTDPLQSISTAGGYYSNGKINVSYNIGDPIFYSDSNFFTTYLIFQGFEQPDRFDKIFTPEVEDAEYDVTYFPNPFRDVLKIRIVRDTGKDDEETFTIVALDVLGRVMELPSIDGKVFNPSKEGDNTIVLDMTPLTSDQIYYFTIRAVKGDFVKTIKAIKID